MSTDAPLRLSDFSYDLPPDRIAQTAAEPRDASRLLVLHRSTGALEHRVFRDLPNLLEPGDLLVLNDSRVLPARLLGRKTSGGRAEVLLLRPLDGREWEALVFPGRRLRPDSEIVFGQDEARLRIGERTEAGGRKVRFEGDLPVEAVLSRFGQMPLPPYIHDYHGDPERYQTVYARAPGSAAAPTAGLHFTPELLAHIQARGVGITQVTLHVGLDTFRPIKTDDVAQHVMHSEEFEIPEEAAEAVSAARGRVIAVGTTVVRALESAVEGGRVTAGRRATRLFIRPGDRFQVVDGMVTNFHLPRSTLLVLVAAFAGRETVLDAYRTAIREGYRFYSFGDAMLIV